MERLMCEYELQNMPKAMCTYDRESDTEPDDCMTCGEVCETFVGQGCEECPVQKVFDRLAEYEDTGHTAEEIRKFDNMYLEKCREVVKLQEQVKNLQAAAGVEEADGKEETT